MIIVAVAAVMAFAWGLVKLEEYDKKGAKNESFNS